VAYSEPKRRYHDVRHIDDCLAQLDTALSLADAPEEVELALWFHDAVYDTTSSQNETRSAEWATTFLQAAGAAADKSARVAGHILATRHSAEPLSGDAALVVDVDLSILGRDPPEFATYEQAIREEYRWVPRLIYRRKRAEILQSFLDRRAIYQTSHFHARFERQARDNLDWAIQRLRG
jgi:predicted metal-dependent HD superfamily phosphohydrolase